MSVFQKKPLIYLITKGETTPENFREKSVETLAVIEQAVFAKTTLIQIREKLLPAKLLYELTLQAARITENSETKLLVNDRADVARAADADGVHLTSTSVPARIIRNGFGEKFIIGVSAHNLDEIEKAKHGGADFATFSPIYATPSKAEYGAPQGVENLRETVRATQDFPVIALGGIDETNYRKVLEIAAGFAAIRFLNDAENLRKLSLELQK